MSSLEEKTVLEKHMLESREWSEGYREFSRLFGKSLGWLFLFRDGKNKLIRLDQKGNCSFFEKSASNQMGCFNFLMKYFEQLKIDSEQQTKLPYFYKCAYGREGVVFGVRHMEQLKGFLVLCTIEENQTIARKYISIFQQFLHTQIELAYKNYELQNFYETVHPRALALSTMHSVNRIISSSLRLDQLLPQIGRLFAQILKSKDCAIYFLDSERKYLIPKFLLQNNKAIVRQARIRVGSGIEGRVAETVEFYFSKKCIALPFIDDDVIGVVSLKHKIDRKHFTHMDLEILKTLTEQASIAIKNARLFEETEQLTLSSVQAINELLDLSYGRSNLRLPLFGELVFELGRALSLSSIELTSLQRATFLIDTGHLLTPEHILNKSSSLTKVEYEQVKRHPKQGVSVLAKMGSLQTVMPIVLHHHERFDGHGYPNGLKGDEIPLGARIVTLVDSFTAMLSHRPYRHPKTISQAIDEIKKQSSGQFDPRIVARFFDIVGRPEIVKKIERFIENAYQAQNKKLNKKRIHVKS